MATADSASFPDEIGFLLLPEFSMMAFFSAVEPLRIANRLGGRAFYRWRLYTEDGAPVVASNSMSLLADASIGEEPTPATVMVCASFNVEQYITPRMLHWLGRLQARGTVLGGIDTGCFALAEAGLLDDYRVTLHWESIPAFRERFPRIETTSEVFEIDRDRITSSGGTATMDLMLQIIARRHGAALALAVSEQLIHDRIRDPTDHQRIALAARLGIHNRALLAAIGYMGRHIERPAATPEIARHAGVSLRQLERLFAEHLGTTARHYYLALRLDHARNLLQQTDMSVLEVGLACGFGSSASLSRAYRRRFGAPPSRDRQWLGREPAGDSVAATQSDRAADGGGPRKGLVGDT